MEQPDKVCLVCMRRSTQRWWKTVGAIAVGILCGATVGGCIAALGAIIGAWCASDAGPAVDLLASSVSSGAVTGQ